MSITSHWQISRRLLGGSLKIKSLKVGFSDHLVEDEVREIDTKLADLKVKLLGGRFKILSCKVGLQAGVARDPNKVGGVVEFRDGCHVELALERCKCCWVEQDVLARVHQILRESKHKSLL